MGEATRGDLGCPTYAPNLTTAGHVSVTGNLSANTFLGSGAGLTNIPAGAITGLGGATATDRISSSGVASGAGLGAVVTSYGTVSFTTGGTAGTAYLDSTGRYIGPGISLTTHHGISSTNGYFSGNVGIGTTTPDANLTVGANEYIQLGESSSATPLNGFARVSVGSLSLEGNWPSLKFNGYWGGAANKYISSDASYALWMDPSTDKFSIQYAAAGTAGDNISYSNGLTMDSSGNVGIGTTSPAYKFHVNAGTNANLHLRADDFSGVGSGMGIVSANDANNAFASMAFGASKFVFSNGNVGIGTTAPTAVLDISSTGTLFQFGNTAYGKVYGGADGNQPWFGTATSNDLRLIANTAEVMRLKSGGNVGIGTTNPTNKLQIEGTGNQTLEVRTNTSGDARIQMHNAGANIFGFRALRSGDGISIEDFSTSSENEIARFMNNGKVGIGTTAPNAALEVAGTVSASTLVISSSVAIGIAAASTSLHVVGPAGNGKYSPIIIQPYDSTGSNNIQWRSDAVGTAAVAIGMSMPGTAVSTDMVFSTSGWSERMRLTQAGNLGIGTSSPAAKLEVAGTISATALNLNGVAFSGNSVAVDRISSSGVASGAGLGAVVASYGTVSFTTGGTAGTAYLDSTGRYIGPGISLTTLHGISSTNGYYNGYVGIGTASPLSTLSLGTNKDFRMQTGSVYFTATPTPGGTDGLVWDTTHASSYWQWKVNGTNAIMIDNNRKVGIGTTAPSYLLDVIGTTDTSLGRVYASNTTLAYFDIANGSTTTNSGAIMRLISKNAAKSADNSVDFVKYQGGGFYINHNETNAAATMNFGVGASTRMTIDANGNVGIGTTSPAVSLSVVGTLGVGESGSTGGRLRLSSSGSGAVINQADNSNMFFQTNSSTKMTIQDSTGNVGIGTTAPSYRLSLVSSSSYASQIGQMQIADTDTSMRLNVGVGTDGTNKVTWLQSTETGVSNDRNLALQPYGGKVGIATTVPNATLEVAGSISSTALYVNGVQITTNGSSSTSATAVSLQTFTSSGTWTRPSGITKVRVYVVGAGGGGGRGQRSGSQPSYGGGSGATVVREVNVTSTASAAVVIGTGGIGGTAVGQAGTSGGQSSWGSIVALGGSGGSYSAVGAGGTASTSTVPSWVPSTLPALANMNHAGNSSAGSVPTAGGASLIAAGGAAADTGSCGDQGEVGSYGSGGGGGMACGGDDGAGGNGGNGVVLVYEYN